MTNVPALRRFRRRGVVRRAGLALIGAALAVLAAGAGGAAPPGPGSDAPPPAPRPRPVPAAASNESDSPRLMLPVRIDMGNGPWLPGSFMCSADYRDGSFGWLDGMVKNGYRRSQSDTWLCDFVEGDDATFAIPVEPDTGRYEIRVTLGDPALPRGPVRVSVAEQVIVDTLETAAGESRTISFAASPRNGRIEIRFETGSCRGFAVDGIEVSGPPGARLGALFPAPTYPPVPDPATLPRMTLERERRLLRQICDHLIRSSPRQGCFSYHGAWYENSYPIRTLLAGSRILKEPRYAGAAFQCLDRFVSRQAPDGNWLSGYFGPARCDTVVPADSATANLADVGTMVLSLAAAVPAAEGARHDRYLAAARLYADSVSLPNQQLDGSFPNRLWAGVDFGHPYTIATATQTAALAALSMVTGDARYRQAAEAGARWLAAGAFLDDGRLVLHPHDQETVQVKESTDFGNVFYVVEALLWTRRATPDESLKQAIDTTLDHWLFGSEGVRAKAANGYWWPVMDVWNSSKMAGMIFVLAAHPRRQTDPAMATWLDRALGWLSDRTRAESIGVLADPASPRGNFSLAATGFAGIGVAGAIDPAGLYPHP